MFRDVGRGAVFIWKQGDIPSAPPDPGPGPPDTVPPGTYRPRRRFELRTRSGRAWAFTTWRPGAQANPQSFTYTPTGGFSLAGVVQVRRENTWIPSGGVNLGGTAQVTFGPEPEPPPPPPPPTPGARQGMLRDRAVEIIAQRLGYRTTLTDTIRHELRIVQAEELEGDNEFKPWFLFKDRSDLVTVPEQDWVALPADFLLQIDDVWLYYKEPSADIGENPWVPVTGNHMSTAIAWTDNVVTLRPRYASIQGDRIYLRPTPESVLELRLVYFAAEPELTENISNKWLLHASEWLIAATASKIAAAYLQDDKAAALQASLAAAARKRLWMKSETLLNTGMDFIKGGED